MSRTEKEEFLRALNFKTMYSNEREKLKLDLKDEEQRSTSFSNLMEVERVKGEAYRDKASRSWLDRLSDIVFVGIAVAIIKGVMEIFR